MEDTTRIKLVAPLSIDFASLHNHTSKSLLDAVMSAEELVQQAYDMGYKAVAITEHGNMFSFVDGYKKAKELGIKYIAGIEAYETDNMLCTCKDSKRYHLILLAKSNRGLQNLFKIVTLSNTHGFYGKPRVDLRLLAQYSEDVICMSSCLGGRINRTMGHSQVTDEAFEKAVELVYKYKNVFGDNFYLEMQSHNTEEQFHANRNLVRLARETNTKLTITFDTHLRDGSELQRNVHALFIQTSQDRDDQDFTNIVDTYTGCWQQSLDEVHETMDDQVGYEIVEEAIRNTHEISNQCNIDIPLGQEHMPHIVIPEGFDSELEYLKQLINDGWINRGFYKWPKEKRDIYRQRIRDEIEILEYLGYCGYFIMLYQLTNAMRERGIPLGYSRGSGGNCLILYTIGVTEVDSIKWNLDFSRFANKGRKGSGMADYDMDMSQRRRQEALDIASELFGKEHICQVATFNSMSPKVCIRDLGKALDEQGVYNIPYPVRDKISKLVPDDPNKKMTIERALELNPELRKYQKKYPLLFEYTKYLQNLPKSVGCHAAAVLITPEPVVSFCPLMLNKDGNIMSQIEMHNAMDDLGLIKMDFLGLKTLDVVDDTLKMAGLTWNDIDLATMNLDDADVFENIYANGKTLGIFQMESFVAQKMYQEMKPNINIYDVFAVNAMNRPAILSVGMQNVYIHNKKKPEDVEYLHPDLAQIFGETNGIMLYQEQALKVFRYAGFPEDETDTARRAIGKKKEDVMKALYVKFADGLDKLGWTNEQVMELWKLVEAQAGYSFNAGHSTSYGLLSYVTAYLKYHYPVEFMTALLISEIGNYDNITKYINECHEMGIEVLPPDINNSDTYFTSLDGKILFGLLSIKGVGENAVEQILESREYRSYSSVTDFTNRVKLDSGTMVSLIKSGAFGTDKNDILQDFADNLFEWKTYKPVKTLPTKAKLYEMDIIRTDDEFKDKEKCLVKLNAHKEELHRMSQTSKYAKHMNEFEEKYMQNPDMYEFDTLSIYLSGNPYDGLEKYFPPYDEIEQDQKVMIGGTVAHVQSKRTRKGGKMAYLHVLTLYGMCECVAFPDVWNTHQEILSRGTNVILMTKRSDTQFSIIDAKTLDVWKAEKLANRGA